MRRVLLALSCGFLLLYPSIAAKKKKEDGTQTLRIPHDPPAAVTADPRTLVFRVSPLSNKGLLTAQVNDALRYLMKADSGNSIIKIRAFVAGRGDLRRIRDVVSETFAGRKLAIPVVSVVQAGGLPLDGAQVVLESTAVSRGKSFQENGLALISGQVSTAADPAAPLAPLAVEALRRLKLAVKGAGSEPSDVLRVTCFVSMLDSWQHVRDSMTAEYSKAAFNIVQVQRSPAQAIVECEAVARLRSKPAAPLQFLNPEGLETSLNYSQVALVASPQVVLTGTQNSFGLQEADAKLAFERLAKVLEQSGTSMRQIAFSSFYPLSPSIAGQVRRIRNTFYDMARPPASTMLPFEGLPSMDAGFAVDVMATKN